MAVGAPESDGVQYRERQYAGIHGHGYSAVCRRAGQGQFAMAATNSAHMLPEGNDFTATRPAAVDSWETTYSGNSVSLEQEMMKEGEINRSFSLNTNIKRAFHQMLMISLK
jgi:flagellar basal-body rod protein FlgB